jgi:hypothetical protein
MSQLRTLYCKKCTKIIGLMDVIFIQKDGGEEERL